MLEIQLIDQFLKFFFEPKMAQNGRAKTPQKVGRLALRAVAPCGALDAGQFPGVIVEGMPALHRVAHVCGGVVRQLARARHVAHAVTSVCCAMARSVYSASWAVSSS